MSPLESGLPSFRFARFTIFGGVGRRKGGTFAVGLKLSGLSRIML